MFGYRELRVHSSRVQLGQRRSLPRETPQNGQSMIVVILSVILALQVTRVNLVLSNFLWLDLEQTDEAFSHGVLKARTRDTVLVRHNDHRILCVPLFHNSLNERCFPDSRLPSLPILLGFSLTDQNLNVILTVLHIQPCPL